MHVLLRNVVWLVLPCVAADLAAQGGRRTYAITVADKVVGWQVDTETPRTDGGRAVLDVKITNMVKLEVLGSSIDQRIEQLWTLDAGTRAVLAVRAQMDAGTVQAVVTGALGAEGFSFAGEAAGASRTTIDPAKVVIAPDYRFLLRPEFAKADKVQFSWFMPELDGVQPAAATAMPGEREFTVLGERVRARGWTIDVPAAGMTMTVFVDADGDIAHSEVPSVGMVIAPATAAMIERLQRVDITHTIVGKTNLRIDDPTPVTYMKVKVQLAATKDVTAASLTVPGQTFTGTVSDGRVDGVFEIRMPRPDGTGALPFPIADGAVAAEELQPFLRAEPGVECDDPAIVAVARELAAGATTSFEVVRRCADWVHANVTYVIPGGGTAARVMATRQGECGGHSHLLAAMLRAVGIPARTPMGGMYAPLYGGSFGQHMWNEVWLGASIGWLPVDCTAGQSTFVDSSHIRLASQATAFRPQALEVLDWEPKSAAGAAPPSCRTDAFPWAAGESVTFVWRRGGKELGTETMTYAGRTDDGSVFTSALDLGEGHFKESVRTVVGDDGRLRSSRVERRAGGQTSLFSMQVRGRKATVEQRVGDEERTDDVDIDDGAFALHNNCVAHFAILASRLPELADGVEARVNLVHDEMRSQLGLQLRGGPATTIEVGGVAVPVRKLTASLSGMQFELHVDQRGRLLRWWQQQGDILVEAR